MSNTPEDEREFNRLYALSLHKLGYWQGILQATEQAKRVMGCGFEFSRKDIVHILDKSIAEAKEILSEFDEPEEAT